MLTFKQYLEEKNREAYGWLNDKGSFIKNRDGDIHVNTYTKFGKPNPKLSYDDKFDDAFKKGWQRMDIRRDDSDRSIYGLIQGKEKKWTPRHSKAMARIKKAMGVTTYRNTVDKIRED